MTGPTPWERGNCSVAMWDWTGMPSGLCDKPAYGHQLPLGYLAETRGWRNPSFCFGHCCPDHGGPRDGEPIIFRDGLTSEGRPMWCAVFPNFANLQESPAGFSGDPTKAVADLLAQAGAA